MDKKSKTHLALSSWWNFRLQLILESTLIGLIVGLLIVLLRVLLDKADSSRGLIYDYIHMNGYWAAIAWFLILLVIAVILGLIVKEQPMASGSGIPQVRGVLLGHLKMQWLKIIVAKFIGGVLAIGAGLSLGREGPSIQLGGAVGQGLSHLLGRLKMEEKYLITCGASAGLAAAFNAPLAGVIFVLEEMHKNFSSIVLTSAIAASITADFVSQKFFGQKPIFNFHDLPVFPFGYYFYLILLGVIIGAFGALFNRSIMASLNLYSKQKLIPKIIIPAIPLIIGGILGFYLPQTLGGGHKLIESIGQGHWDLKFIFLLILVKFLFTMISYGSGVPGGIFLPLLVIGALTGDLYANIVVQYMHVNAQYITNFVVLAMAAYFTAIVKAPVTGSILITEMTGSFSHLLPLITISMVAYLVSDILKAKPIYEMLLERILTNKGDSGFIGSRVNKEIIEIAVYLGSQIDGKFIKDVNWPIHALLVGIKRGESEIIPKGDTKIFVGDYLIVLTDEDQSAHVKRELNYIVSEGKH